MVARRVSWGLEAPWGLWGGASDGAQLIGSPQSECVPMAFESVLCPGHRHPGLCLSLSTFVPSFFVLLPCPRPGRARAFLCSLLRPVSQVRRREPCSQEQAAQPITRPGRSFSEGPVDLRGCGVGKASGSHLL